MPAADGLQPESDLPALPALHSSLHVPAAGNAGDGTVRADLTDKGVAELALIENLLRRDLDAIEEARAYQSMIDHQGYSVESLAALLGHTSTGKVIGRLSLLKLDGTFQEAIQKAVISPSQGLEMSRVSIEGQYQLWRAIQDGRADSQPKLRRLAAAIFDLENQVELFTMEPVTPAQAASLSKVDRFVADAGRLLSMITEDDLTVIREVQKSDASVALDRIALLLKVMYRVQNALEDNQAKQQALSA